MSHYSLDYDSFIALLMCDKLDSLKENQTEFPSACMSLICFLMLELAIQVLEELVNMLLKYSVPISLFSVSNYHVM